MDTITLFGSSGAAILLIAFALNQFHIWHDDDIAYDAFNFFGGLILTLYAIRIESVPFALLNGIWTLVSLRDVFLDLRKKKS